MHTESAEPDLTPMLDVVFIMLIFFIVTATFVKEVGVSLPSGDKKTETQSATQSLMIDISPTDQFTIMDEPVDHRMLKNRLAAYFAEEPDRPIIVRPNKDTSTNALVYALDVGRSLGIDIKLAASPDQN